MNTTDAYEKYKHLDNLLSDPDWLGSELRWMVLGDLWQAVKNAVLTTGSTLTAAPGRSWVAEDDLAQPQVNPDRWADCPKGRDE